MHNSAKIIKDVDTKIRIGDMLLVPERAVYWVGNEIISSHEDQIHILVQISPIITVSAGNIQRFCENQFKISTLSPQSIFCNFYAYLSGTPQDGSRLNNFAPVKLLGTSHVKFNKKVGVFEFSNAVCIDVSHISFQEKSEILTNLAKPHSA